MYDATSGHLFVIDRRTSPNRLVEINPANGAEISSFALPFNAGDAGLAINPLTGNLWYGSDQSTNVVELTRTGTVLRQVSLAAQGIDNNEIAGLAFDAQATSTPHRPKASSTRSACSTKPKMDRDVYFPETQQRAWQTPVHRVQHVWSLADTLR